MPNTIWKPALALVAFVALGAGHAYAEAPGTPCLFHRRSYCCPPPVTYCCPRPVTYCCPPPAPCCAPAVTYAAPAPCCAPAVTYALPAPCCTPAAAYHPGGAVTTVRYGLFGRPRWSSTYYTPGYYAR